MGKLLIVSISDHEEHILNKIMEIIADEPELDHIALPPSNASLSFPGLEIRLKEQTVSCSGQLVTLTHPAKFTRLYGIKTANAAVLPLPASSARSGAS